MPKKLDAKILIALIKEDFNMDAVVEYKFSRDIVGDGKGIRERLKQAGLKDWRFDVAIPKQKIAIEFEGGLFQYGRHNRAMGMIGDIHKYNTATAHGWRVLRYTHTHHKYKDILEHLKIIFK